MIKHLLVSILVLAISSSPPSAELHAQSDATADAGAHWQALALYVHTHLQDQRDWRTATLLAGRASASRTVLLQLDVVEREGIRESAVGTDLYQSLDGGGYVNLRARVAPGAETLPSWLAGVDLYRSLGRAWEGWVGYELRTYPLTTVHTVAFGPGVYLAAWYLRGRPSVSVAAGEATLVGQLVARRFFADSPTDYIELGGGIGREFVEMVPSGTGRVEIDAESTWVVTARAQRFLTAKFGVAAAGVYQSYEDLGRRPSFSIGLLGRW